MSHRTLFLQLLACVALAWLAATGASLGQPHIVMVVGPLLGPEASIGSDAAAPATLPAASTSLPRRVYLPLVGHAWGAPASLPDLSVDYVYINMRGYHGGCVTEYDALMIVACIRNRGAAAVGPFWVTVNGIDAARLTGLPAGARTCVETIELDRVFDPVTVEVDRANEVAESDESNNVWQGMVPIPTPPVICAFTMTPSPTATARETATATPTETETPTMSQVSETGMMNLEIGHCR
jgi:hypothetical protein